MSGDQLPFICTCITFVLCYYTYVIEFVFNSVPTACRQVVYLLIFHIFYCITLFLFIVTVCDRGWKVPDKYKIPQEVYQKLLRAYLHEEDDIIADMCQKRKIVVHMRTREGVKRVCYKCKHIKPDRAYHCRKCKTCVCRMDHHCVFLNNCIGATNMKYFIFMNIFVAIMNLYCGATELEYIVQAMSDGKDVGLRISYIVLSAIVTIMLGIACAILAAINLIILGKNTSMVESKYKPIFEYEAAMTYNKGCWNNLKENCGSNVFKWCLPYNFGTLDQQYQLVELSSDRYKFHPKTEGDYLEIELKGKQRNILRKV